jgi:hypothetical protein
MPGPACPASPFETFPAAKSFWYCVNAGLREAKCGVACADTGIVNMLANKTVTSNATVIKDDNFENCIITH